MTASKAAREKRAAAQAGPYARVRIDLDDRQRLVHKITCTSCTARGDRPWSAYRPGGDNGYLAAMDRWILHLVQRHPDADAPCLAYRAEAEVRLTQRREQR